MCIWQKLNRRDLLKATSLPVLACLGDAFADSGTLGQIVSPNGFEASAADDGTYRVVAADYGWTFAENLGGAPGNVTVTNGTDQVGHWQELGFSHAVGRQSAIRLYDDLAIVLFTTTYNNSTSNGAPFPSFQSYPQGLATFSYGGVWAYQFGSLNARSPWLFFDKTANAVILSPAANFMTALSQIANDGSMQSAIDPRIATLPAGFTHRSILAFAHGINSAFDVWGRALIGLGGKRAPSNDAVTALSKLSYWTDATSAYYYYQESEPSHFEPTLSQVPPAFLQLSAPLGSMELDSWHYPKGSPPSWTDVAAGLATFDAAPILFPDGLAAFQKTIGLPLIAHTRWIDPTSPYCNQYKMSGNVSIDPLYWQDYANYLVSSGVEVLEQDWLSGAAVPDFNLTDPDAFLDNMASAMRASGRSIIYCMPMWTHIMQSSKYDNVIAVRLSQDGFDRSRWDDLLFNSRIASAVGLWPFADALKSQNVMDVLVATLTAGPLASGDAVTEINGPNLNQAVRSDGVIVKPDVPVVPTDSTFLALSQSSTAPVCAFSYTAHDALRTGYVLAYSRTSGAASSISFSPESIGVSSPSYVFEYFGKTGVVLGADEPFTTVVGYAGAYFVVAPIGPSGIAFLGDANKFVACGKKRIDQLSNDGVVTANVVFAPGEEHVILHFYSRSAPIVSATEGAVNRLSRGRQGRYYVRVTPGSNGAATLIIQTASDLDQDRP